MTETLSPVADLGQDKKDNEDEPDAKKQKFDTLSLRNRDVTETLSPLDNWTKKYFSTEFLSTTRKTINYSNNITAMLRSESKHILKAEIVDCRKLVGPAPWNYTISIVVGPKIYDKELFFVQNRLNLWPLIIVEKLTGNILQNM